MDIKKTAKNTISAEGYYGAFFYYSPKPLCYKINLSISPEWKEILGLIVPEQYKDNPFKFTSEIIEEIKKDPEAEIDFEGSLLQKSFRFVYFYSELTGMEQIMVSITGSLRPYLSPSGNDAKLAPAPRITTCGAPISILLISCSGDGIVIAVIDNCEKMLVAFFRNAL